MDELSWEESIYAGLSSSQPVHERVLQIMYFPYTCSEVQINIQRRLFLAELINFGDGVQLFAVEPGDQKLENSGVIGGETKGSSGTFVDVDNSLLEPLILSQ